MAKNTDCDHPEWATETDSKGKEVCRICNPKPLGDNDRMYH